jgi:hypothetical protein
MVAGSYLWWVEDEPSTSKPDAAYLKNTLHWYETRASTIGELAVFNTPYRTDTLHR